VPIRSIPSLHPPKIWYEVFYFSFPVFG